MRGLLLYTTVEEESKDEQKLASYPLLWRVGCEDSSSTTTVEEESKQSRGSHPTLYSGG